MTRLRFSSSSLRIRRDNGCVSAFIDNELGEAEGVALLFLPRSPDTNYSRGTAIGYAGLTTLDLVALITGLEEAGHRYQAEMALLSDTPAGWLLAHRFRSAIHR